MLTDPRPAPGGPVLDALTGLAEVAALVRALAAAGPGEPRDDELVLALLGIVALAPAARPR